MPQSVLRSHTLRTIALQTDRDKRTVQRWYEKACSDCAGEIGEVIDGTRYFSDNEREMMLAYMGEKPKLVESEPVEPEKQAVTVEISSSRSQNCHRLTAWSRFDRAKSLRLMTRWRSRPNSCELPMC